MVLPEVIRGQMHFCYVNRSGKKLALTTNIVRRAYFFDAAPSAPKRRGQEKS